jgi:acyl carrier protein
MGAAARESRLTDLSWAKPEFRYATAMETGAAADPGAIERDVLAIVGGLVGELRGGTSHVPVAPGSSLERDLGISSLERVELLLRLERRFGVRLPEETVASAETPADLVAALDRAAPASRDDVQRSQIAVPAAATSAPVDARTLLEAVQWHVRATPDRVHIVLHDETSGGRPITYRSLWDGALDVGAALAERGRPR